MRIIAAHDEMGNVLGLAIPVDEVAVTELIAGEGEYLSEIEVQDDGNRQRPELLADLARNYRVERVASPGRLVKKRAPGASTGK